MELDVLSKFNRGLILSLAGENVYDAVVLYREYVSFLSSLENKEEAKKELAKINSAFLGSLIEFVKDKKNENKTKDLICAYQELLSAFNKNLELYKGASNVFLKLKQEDIAKELLEKAHSINPRDLEVLRLLFDLCDKTRDFNQAIKIKEKLIELEPDNSYNYFDLAKIYDNIYEKTGDETNLKTAILNLLTAKKINPKEPFFYRSLIVQYTKTGDKENLNKIWQEYSAFPFSNRDKFDLGANLIRNGEFKKGFELLEARFKLEDTPVPYPKISKPLYDGKKDISKKTLLICKEQGYGDVFLFSRLIAKLKNKAKKIVIALPFNLISLIERSIPFAKIVDIELINNGKFNEFDYHLPMMSLPHVLGLQKENVKENEVFIVPDRKKVESFKKELFNSNKLKVGISFKGNEIGMKSRNIPFEFLKPLFDIEGAEFYSIQFGEPDSTFEGVPVINLADKIKTFDDTSSIIQNLDVIVTVDNSSLNLAGAMGKKTFGLFNKVSEYRWFDLEGEDVKWYSSVKPYKCKFQHDWEPVIKKVKEDLKRLIK